MSAIQKIFQMYGSQYIALYGERMPQSHKKTIRDIIACRNGSFGTMVYECSECCKVHFIHCGCGNRHCPNCQHNKADQWLNQQMKKLLPTHYFLLTITLPQGLRDVVRSNQKQSYGALFSCTNEALKKLAQDTRFIGSDRIGYLAVLHTWAGMLQYHPHLHLVIPGGALSDNNDQWLSSRQDLFVHTKPLEVIFKAKFKDAMKKAGLLNKVDPAVWKQQWVIDSQAVGQGQNCLRYLSRYVFRVAISNNRIKSIENDVIKFLYKDREKKKWKIMALDAMEFIRRFLQHVLPKGFMKIRHYGFLNPNSVLLIEKIRELISLIHDMITLFVKTPAPEIPSIKCSHCGHVLKFVLFVKPDPQPRPG
jgi:hypothetical protein